MIDSKEKECRLSEWESTLTDMRVKGSLRAWRFFLLDEINNMLNEQLINTHEAKSMRERVEQAYAARETGM